MAQEPILLIVLLKTDPKSAQETAIQKSTAIFPAQGKCEKTLGAGTEPCRAPSGLAHAVRVLGQEQELNPSVPFILLASTF